MEGNVQILDPDFLRMGMEVYTREYVETLREDNLSLPPGSKMYNIIPQTGFQEKVLTCDADVLIIGGKRGGGKTAVMELVPLEYIENPLFTCYGFRKEEKDIKKGLWNTSKQIYTGYATPKESYFTWEFPSGAKVIFEHLQNENEIDRRFRGVEIPCMLIDELPQISFKTFFTLLASNRNGLGIKNKFVASCNPVSRKNWVYKLISWYIDENTNQIIKERSGVTRYFYKYGSDITEIAWGDSKEEVYEKAKAYIDMIYDERLSDSGGSKYDLITSFCFIEGEYADNKIFRKKDPNYLGRLAQQGGRQSIKDINGIWGDDEESEALLTSQDIELMFNNTPQTTGFRTAVADVALTLDNFVIGAFNGKHLYDIEIFTGVGSETAKEKVKNFLKKNNIRKENFLFDLNGIGQYLVEPFSESQKFNNNSRASNPEIWGNLKSECAEQWVTDVKEGKYSVDPNLKNRKFKTPYFKDLLLTLEDLVTSERPALKRKIVTNGKYTLIQKYDMKIQIGHSPDIIEMLLMHAYFTKHNNNNDENLEAW